MSVGPRSSARGTARQRELVKLLRSLCPRIPLADFNAAIETAAARHLKHLPPSIALWQAVASRARHAHTEYDALLAEGYDRESARHFVLDEMNIVLGDWGCQRKVSGEADEGE